MFVGMVRGCTQHLFAYTRSVDRDITTTSRQIAAVIKTRIFPGWRRRTSSHIGKMQSTSPIPPNRQTTTALFRCRTHWKTSHIPQTVKGIHHSRARLLKRNNRRHHGLSTECTGPGRSETTNSRKPVTMSWRSGRPTISNTPSQFLRCGRHFGPRLATPKRIYDINTTQLKSPDMNKFLC